MTTSFFTNLFAYRQRENNTPLENFLTEIFSFCLQTDINFRNSFFKVCLKINSKGNCLISTQNEYEEFGRPDIEIELDNYSILIENKVDSTEGLNQLNRYASILRMHKQDDRKKIVVFLTKIFEQKILEDNTVQLIQIRWYEIHNIISSSNTETTKLLKEFLTDYNMSKSLNFNDTDLSALKVIPQTLDKMDELLNRFEKEFKDNFGGFSSKASRSSRLALSFYTNYVELWYDDLQYWLNIGFIWNDFEPSVYIGLEFNSKKFKLTELYKIFDEELLERNDWEFEDVNNYTYYSKYKKISEFDTTKEDHILGMQTYLKEHLDTLIKLKKKYPKLLTK